MSLRSRYWLIVTAAILLSVAGSAAQVDDKAKAPTKVFILAGQSNCVGKGCGDQLPEVYKSIDPGILLFWNGYGWKGWAPVAPYPSPQGEMYGCGDTLFGPEIGFAHAMREAYPARPIRLVKVCVGGTSVVSWSRDFGSEANRHLMEVLGYKMIESQKNLHAKLVEDVREALGSLDEPYEVGGFVWVQAEKDSLHPHAAGDWARRVLQLHRDLAGEIGYPPDIPLVVMSPHIQALRLAEPTLAVTLMEGIQMAADQGGTVTMERLIELGGLQDVPHREIGQTLKAMRVYSPAAWLQAECVGIMNRALRELAAATPNLVIVESGDLPTHEGLHFDTEGQLELGRRLASGCVLPRSVAPGPRSDSRRPSTGANK